MISEVWWIQMRKAQKAWTVLIMSDHSWSAHTKSVFISHTHVQHLDTYMATPSLLFPALALSISHTVPHTDRIFKMHVYTLVWLKLDRIRFLIVGLIHLDYSIDSRITPACIRSINWIQILRSAQAPDFFPLVVSRKSKDSGVFPLKSPQQRAPLWNYFL